MNQLLGNITITHGPWLIPSLILLGLGLILLIWAYRSVWRHQTAYRWAFMLKTLGLLCLALILLEPLWSGRHAKPGANVMAVVADNSRSMTIRGPEQVEHRGHLQQEALTVKANWLESLAGYFQVRRYQFDSRLRHVGDFSELTYTGQSSDLHGALSTLGERYRNQSLAGIFLLSDGNPTDLPKESLDWTGLPPVYPVVVGTNQALRDLAITNVAVTQTSFEDAPVTIQADVEALGYQGRPVFVDLNDGAGARMERQRWQVKNRREKRVFRFRLRPKRSGVLYYQIQVSDAVAPVDANAVADESESSRAIEATGLNNRRTVVVHRGQGPYRILYVTGRPNWEYKYLRRALDKDEQVQLVGLIRVAKREPKYDWRGRRGEQSNPLYRGYDDGKGRAPTESYDQPVLVRLGTRDATELQEGFPKEAEALFAYHAIILDDVDASFFQRDQMELIRRFVAERGGGFLMLGGADSFQRGRFEHTPIASILPVYLDPLSDQTAPRFNRMNLTREGWLQPWVRLRENETEEKQRLANMSDFRVLNRLKSVKPGARVLATIDSESNESFPALVVQRFGKGRAAALTVGDLWRWGLQDAGNREDQGKFWRQTLRWLVADVPERHSIEVLANSEAGKRIVDIHMQARHPDYTPMDNLSVSVIVSPPPGGQVRLHAEPVAGESGAFATPYVPRISGGYTARALFTDLEGNQVGEAVTGWGVNLEAQEFQSTGINRGLLEELAQQTGGEVLEPDELDSYVKTLPQRSAPVTVLWTKPLWDLPGLLPALFLSVLVCFGGEWILRRWKGLP